MSDSLLMINVGHILTYLVLHLLSVVKNKLSTRLNLLHYIKH